MKIRSTDINLFERWIKGVSANEQPNANDTVRAGRLLRRGRGKPH
jgi:hypothetical protein